jgi:hypothetical protein
MKRNEQIGWVFICFILAAVLEIALFQCAIDYRQSRNQNLFEAANPTLGSDLFTNCNSKDLPSRNENQSSQRPLRVYCIQAASISGSWGNYSPVTHQAVPCSEKSLKSNGPLILLSFFVMIFAVRVFAIFYRLARSNPGDDWLPFKAFLTPLTTLPSTICFSKK